VDVNECKFLAPDVPLFHAICADLFPGVDAHPPAHAALRGAILRQCASSGLQQRWHKRSAACLYRRSVPDSVCPAAEHQLLLGSSSPTWAPLAACGGGSLGLSMLRTLCMTCAPTREADRSRFI